MKTVRLSGHGIKSSNTRDGAISLVREPGSDGDAVETENRAARRSVQSVTVRGAPTPPLHLSANPLMPRSATHPAVLGSAHTVSPDTDRGLLAALAAIETAASRPAARAADPYDHDAHADDTHTYEAAAHDERTHEVLRLPATWYAGPVAAPVQTWSAEVKAGAFGLGAGLCLVVPVVLFLGGWFGATTPSALTQAALTVRNTAPLAASLVSPGDTPPFEKQAGEKQAVQIQAVRAQLISDQAAPATLKSVRIVAEPDVILAEVRRSMTAGDIETARLLLAHPVSTGQGEAILLLGETFDPNVLAALGTRGVAADVSRARLLYEEADKRGAASAAMRLRGLN
jgi:hypothetical protein